MYGHLPRLFYLRKYDTWTQSMVRSNSDDSKVTNIGNQAWTMCAHMLQDATIKARSRGLKHNMIKVRRDTHTFIVMAIELIDP